MESYKVHSFVSGFFYSTPCLLDLCTCLLIAIEHSFLLYSIPLNYFITIYPLYSWWTFELLSVLAIMNNSVMNVSVHVFWSTCACIPVEYTYEKDY